MKDIDAMPYARLKSYALIRMARDTKFGLSLLSQLIFELHEWSGETAEHLLRRLVKHADKKQTEE